MMNPNYVIQDADGNFVCDLFKNVKREEDGLKIVELLNTSVPPVAIFPEISLNGEKIHIEIGGETVPLEPVLEAAKTLEALNVPEGERELPVEAVTELVGACKPRKKKLTKAERSQRMKEAWEKRRKVAA